MKVWSQALPESCVIKVVKTSRSLSQVEPLWHRSKIRSCRKFCLQLTSELEGYYLCIHITYQALQEFIQSWNYHRSRTESTSAIYIRLLTVTNCWQYYSRFFEEVLDTHGIEDAGNTPMDGDKQRIEVRAIDIYTNM